MSRRLPIAIVIAGSVILAACGGGGDYEDSLREITEDQEEASVTFDESISESLPGIVADITFMRALIDELPALIESTNDGIAGLEELDPPEEFAADHQRWIDGMRVRIDLAEQTIAAAEAGDILEVQRLFAESESAQRALSELRQRSKSSAIGGPRTALAESSRGLSDDEITLPLGVWSEF